MHNEGRGPMVSARNWSQGAPCSPLSSSSLPPSFFPLGRAATRLPAEGNKSAVGPNAESTCRTGSLFTLLQTLVTVSVASALLLSFSLSLSLSLSRSSRRSFFTNSSSLSIPSRRSPIIARGLKWSRCKVTEKEKVSDRING